MQTNGPDYTLTPATRVLDEIRQERKRQIEVEGWTPGHDDTHSDGEMADAAACYAIARNAHWPEPQYWRWSPTWWKPKDRRRNLVRAAALLVSEIERIDRDRKPLVSEIQKTA